MGANHEPHAADEHQHGKPRGARAEQAMGGQGRGGHGEGHEEAAGEPRCVMGGQQGVEQLHKACRDPEIQWRMGQVRFARKIRREPVAPVGQAVDDALAHGFVVFPGCVPGQARQQPGEADQQEEGEFQRSGFAVESQVFFS